MQETDYVDGTKGEGRFKSSQSVQYCNLNLTMQLDEETKRFKNKQTMLNWWENVGPIIIYKDYPESKDTKVLNMYNIFNLQTRHFQWIACT